VTRAYHEGGEEGQRDNAAPSTECVDHGPWSGGYICPDCLAESEARDVVRSSAALIQEREQTTGPMRLIGHLPRVPFDDTTRIALCGAEIAGIKAFGVFDPCVVCDEMWDQLYPEVARVR